MDQTIEKLLEEDVQKRPAATVPERRRFLELLRRGVVNELAGDPETLVVDSTLLSVLHPRQVGQSVGWGRSSSGATWVR